MKSREKLATRDTGMSRFIYVFSFDSDFESFDDRGCWIELEIVVETALHPFFCLLRVVTDRYFVTHDYFQNRAIVRTLDLKFSKRYIKPRWHLFPFCTNLLIKIYWITEKMTDWIHLDQLTDCNVEFIWVNSFQHNFNNKLLFSAFKVCMLKVGW